VTEKRYRNDAQEKRDREIVTEKRDREALVAGSTGNANAPGSLAADVGARVSLRFSSLAVHCDDALPSRLSVTLLCHVFLSRFSITLFHAQR